VPVDSDRAFGGLVEARDQIRDRRLARAAGTDERGELSRLDAQADVTERPVSRRGAVLIGALSWPVGERDVVELDLAADLRVRQLLGPRT
jgi:hypothetical protein